MQKNVLALALAAALSPLVPAGAADFEVSGRGGVAISSGNPQTVKALSLSVAKRNALEAGINRVNGPDSARDPKVADKLPALLDQISDERFFNRRSQSVGDQYETTLTLVMDDMEFKRLLSDAGIAANTTTARSFAILAVMDEFRRLPSDQRVPLEELEEFSSSKGKSFKDKSIDLKSSKAASASAATSSSAVDARASASGKASGSYDSSIDAKRSATLDASARDGYGGQGSISGSASGSLSARDKGSFSAEQNRAASYKESNASSAASASASSNTALSAKNVYSEEHDDVRYKKLIKYQPQNRGPEQISMTYNAFKGRMQEYDLKVLDNDLFRSKYFKNKPITIEQMQKGEELAKYVGYARTDAKADFFLVGSSILIDGGTSSVTGEALCTGVMTVKIFSTISSEDIASDTTSETAAGRNADDCAANVAKKLAAVGGPIISARVQDYWKRRNTYGREYVITLQGAALPDSATRGLSKALKSVPGVEKATLRSQNETEYQMVVVYKGESLKDELDDKLDLNPLFAARHSRVDSDQILICMAACQAPAADNKGKKKK